MPISYRIDESARLVVTRFTGSVTDADLEQHAFALAADQPAADCDEIVLCDATVSQSVSGDAVRDAASHLRTHAKSGGNKLALVAPTEIAFGLSRMFSAFREKDEESSIKVFRKLSEARDWLGLSSDIEL